MIDRAAIRAYLDRDWGAVERSKLEHWAARRRSTSAEQALAVADSLRRGVRELRPDWPSERDRREDLEAHTALSELLRRVAAATHR